MSDSVGETAELVVRAASSQFNGDQVEIRRVPYVDDKETIAETVQAALSSSTSSFREHTDARYN